MVVLMIFMLLYYCLLKFFTYFYYYYEYYLSQIISSYETKHSSIQIFPRVSLVLSFLSL